MALRDAFQAAARAAGDDELEAADVRELHNALDEARLLVDELAEAVPGAERQPRLSDVMSGEELAEFGERVE